MATPQNLETLLSTVDRSVRSIEAEIQSAHEEVAAAKRAVGELRESQRASSEQIAAVQKQIASLQAGQAALRQELTSKLQQLESRVSQHSEQLQQHQAQLDALLSAQKEEAARRRLESEKGRFAVHLGELLAEVHDGPVRYLFAAQALQACSARSIAIESFQSVADQKTIADLLGSLRKVLDEAAASDRAEAALWTKLSAVIEQMATAANDYKKSQALLRVKEGSLAKREQELKQSIAELSAAEPTEQKNQRRRTFIAGVVIGAALLPTTILLQLYSAYPGEYWPLIVGTAAAAAAFLIAWYSSDAHRTRKLAGDKSRLQRVGTERAAAHAEQDHLAQSAQQQVSTTAAALAAMQVDVSKVDLGMPPLAFEALGHAAQTRRAQWVARHPEVRMLAA